MNDEIQYIPRNELKPSPLNPRKVFDLGKLEELGASLRKQGIINPLTVRILPNGTKEIVCGECRWRASGPGVNSTTGEKIPEIVALPVLFRELSDVDTLELMLVENIQRNDLSPIEECDAFARILAEKQDGKPVYTQATLGAKIGKSEGVIQSRLALMKLSKEGRSALQTGLLSYRVARRICDAPSVLVPKIEEAILNEKKYPIDRWPREFGDEMLVEDVTNLIEHMSAWLTSPPFDLADASLVPQKSNPTTGERIEGGACLGCEFNSATHAEPGKRAPQARCMNAACYKKKVDVHVAAELVKANARGEVVLKESEAKKILERGLFGANTTHVELEKKLDGEERAPGLTDKTAPTWEQVVTDKQGNVAVPVVVVVDDNGHVRRFAERKVVAAAADKLGTANKLSIDAGRGKSLDASDRAAEEKKRRQKELAEQKEKMETAFVLADWLATAVEKQRVPEAAAAALLMLAINHSGCDGCKFVCKRRGIDGVADAYLAVRKYGEKLKPGPMLGFVFELLAAKNLTHCAGPYSSQSLSDDLKPLMKFYGVDLAAAKAQAKQKIAEAKKPAKDAKKPEPAKPEKKKPEAKPAPAPAPTAPAKAEKAPELPWWKWDELTKAEKTAVNVHFAAATLDELMKKEYRITSDAAGKIIVLDGRAVEKKKPAKLEGCK